MRRSAVLLAGFAGILLCAGVAAEEKQEKILAAIEASAASVVQIEYECPRTDGKGAQEFQTTGVVINAEGLIMVTNVNQIDPPVGGQYQKPEAYVVHFEKEMKAKASFLGKDEELNLGLLKIRKEEPKEGEKAPVIRPLKLADAGSLKLAQEILLLKRLSREEDFKPTFSLMRVTAVVPKPAGPPTYRTTGSLSGWTGCPVLTLDGKVVGFVGLTSVDPGGGGGRSVTIGGRTYYFGGRGRRGSPRILCTGDFKEFLADPSKFLRRKSWLGIRGLQALTKDLAEQLGVGKGGVIVGEILKASPADKAGLKTGDVVVKIDGEKLDIAEDKDVEKFTKRMERAKGGTKFVFVVLRDKGHGYGEEEINVTIEEEPTREYEVEEWEEKTFGLRVKPLTRDFLDRERLPLDTPGIRVTYVESAGFAYLAGLRRGDIVQGVLLVKTPNLKAFKKRMSEVIAERKPEVCFGVTRRGKNLYLCVRPEWGLVDKEKEEEKKK
ncbi:MAG: PDZ domain-containing protein [Planctomycetota bacterium]|jgi:S1-C subfamily serine protease